MVTLFEKRENIKWQNALNKFCKLKWTLIIIPVQTFTCCEILDKSPRFLLCINPSSVKTVMVFHPYYLKF